MNTLSGIQLSADSPSINTPRADSLHSRFGEIRILWIEGPAGPKVRRIELPSDNTSIPCALMNPKPAGHPSIDRLCDSLRCFLEGNDVVFDRNLLDWDVCSEFQQRVLRAEASIPRGWVSSYRNIALYLGVPNGARAVGGALASNPFPLVIPCHRAIRSDGTVGGFQGGSSMKRSLLEAEGIQFRADGRVSLERIFYVETGPLMSVPYSIKIN